MGVIFITRDYSAKTDCALEPLWFFLVLHEPAFVSQKKSFTALSSALLFTSLAVGECFHGG